MAKAVPLDALSCNLRATVRRVVELGEDLWGQGPKSQGDNTRLGALRGGGRRGLVQTDSFDGTPGPLLVLKPMASDSAAQKSNVSSTASPSRSPRFLFWQKRSFVGCEVRRRPPCRLAGQISQAEIGQHKEMHQQTTWRPVQNKPFESFTPATPGTACEKSRRLGPLAKMARRCLESQQPLGNAALAEGHRSADGRGKPTLPVRPVEVEGVGVGGRRRATVEQRGSGLKRRWPAACVDNR